MMHGWLLKGDGLTSFMALWFFYASRYKIFWINLLYESWASAGWGTSVGVCPLPSGKKYIYMGGLCATFSLIGSPSCSPCVGLFSIFFSLGGHLFPCGKPFLSLWEAFFRLAPPPPTNISVGAHVMNLTKRYSLYEKLLCATLENSKYLKKIANIIKFEIQLTGSLILCKHRC